MLICSIPCFASYNIETIVSYINLNNTGFYDIEILFNKEGKILLPFKQLSEIFEVETKTNHATKEIDFKTQDGKKGLVGLNYIEFDGKKISFEENIYLKTGIMDDIKDEIFCNEKDLSIIFDSLIKTDKNDLSITANTKRNLKLLQSPISNQNNDSTTIKAYTNITKPDKERNIVLESITLNNNTTTDTISNYYLNKSQKNVFFNNNSQILLKGKAYGGDLNVDLNTYNYKGELFSFGGLGFNYHKNYKGFDYELGRIRGIKDNDYTIGNQMLGFQMSNYESKPKSYREIEGTVDKESLVRVYVNNNETTTLNTYDGYYSLNNLYLDENPETIRLEEIKPDCTAQIIYEKNYPKYENMPLEKERKYTLFGGVTGYNNKLFNTNGYIYEMNTKKFLLGAQYEYGIKENLKFDSKLSFDKIYMKPKNAIWQNIYSTDALLTSGTWKNPNNLEGITSLNSLEYIKNDNFKSKISLGISSSKDINFNNPRGGWTLTGETSYTKDKYLLKTGFFNTSSDFYLAGGEGSYYNDRTGLFFSGTATGNNSVVNVNYKKYFSNTEKNFEGGLINFNEYNLGINKKLEKICDISFNITGREGNNSIARNKSYYYNLNLSKRINDSINFQLGKTESNYQTNYSSNLYNDYKSVYTTTYLEGNCKIPRNLGVLSVGHDNIEYNYTNQKNKYNTIKVGYTFPEIKRLTLSLATGYKYWGSDSGFDFSANLAYRTKSGRTINLNYQYNTTGGYIINNMYLPMSNRHSINIALNDAFAISPFGIKSVGFIDDTRGYAIIRAYIDKNKNGKFDKEDIPIKNVPIKFSWANDTTYTNKKGKLYSPPTQAGIYTAKIDLDKLPATLYVDKNIPNEKIIRIDARKNTNIEFPLKSCAGNITGVVKVIDDFGRTLNTNDFIVVLNNEEGKEISYSTVDKNGQFHFSGIEPGKYTVKLDDYFINSNALCDYKDKSKLLVEIPYVYKDFVDINNLNLVYRMN